MSWVNQILSKFQILFLSLSWKDFVDFVLIWFIFYKSLFLVRRSGASRIVSGLAIVIVGYFLSKWLHLVTLNWILEKGFSNWMIIFVILFQNEIRQAFAQVGNPQLFSLKEKNQDQGEVVDEVVKALQSLSNKGLGALIIFEGEVGLDYFIDRGTRLDSHVSENLILSLFDSTSPLHDGAVVVRGQRIQYAGCFLPLTKNPIVDKSLGTRHRAALGISEKTDCFVLVVSEEQRKISLVKEGKLETFTDEFALRQGISEALHFEKNKDLE